MTRSSSPGRRSGPASPSTPTGASWSCAPIRTCRSTRGSTFVLVDMKSPGITVRPLVEMTGEAWFNEVFFDEVRVPRANVVGEIDSGWNVVLTTLGPRARWYDAARAPADRARRACPARPSHAARSRHGGGRSDHPPAHRPARDRGADHALHRLSQRHRDSAHREARSRGLDPQALLERARAAHDGNRLRHPRSVRNAAEAKSPAPSTTACGTASCCGPAPPPSMPAPRKCNETSSPSGCWGCRGRENEAPTKRRRAHERRTVARHR